MYCSLLTGWPGAVFEVLARCAERGHANIIEAVTTHLPQEARAAFRSSTSNNYNIMHLAVRHGKPCHHQSHTPVRCSFLTHGVVDAGHAHVVQCLLELDGGREMASQQGGRQRCFTALQLAAERGDRRCLEVLVEREQVRQHSSRPESCR